MYNGFHCYITKALALFPYIIFEARSSTPHNINNNSASQYSMKAHAEHDFSITSIKLLNNNHREMSHVIYSSLFDKHNDYENQQSASTLLIAFVWKRQGY